MSKLEELIEELCPDGVEYKRFDEVCSLHARIGWHKLKKSEHQKTGDFLLITGTDFTENHEVDYSRCAYVSEDRYLQDPKIQLQNGDILITKDGTLGKTAQVKNLPKPAALNSGVFVVRCKDGSLENRFILHYLLSERFTEAVDKQKTSSTISHLTQELFSRLTIPIPPIEVQKKIAKILDKFERLIQELTHELTLRRLQFQYYRDKLLTFGSDIEFVNLADVCNISKGVQFNKSSMKDSGTYPVINGGISPSGFIEKYNQPENTITISQGGASAGFVNWISTKFWAGAHCYILKPSDSVLDRYLFHFLKSQEKNLQDSQYGAGIPALAKSTLESYQIPVPPIEQQKKITAILDRFDKLCNDLTSGIPAEINARKKQYAFYRDKLLTFTQK